MAHRSLGASIADFLADLARQGRSVHTLRAYRGDLGDRPKPWEVNLLPLLPAAVVPPVVALAFGPPQSSGGVVRARMIRTWRLRRITGRSKS